MNHAWRFEHLSGVETEPVTVSGRCPAVFEHVIIDGERYKVVTVEHTVTTDADGCRVSVPVVVVEREDGDG